MHYGLGCSECVDDRCSMFHLFLALLVFLASSAVSRHDAAAYNMELGLAGARRGCRDKFSPVLSRLCSRSVRYAALAGWLVARLTDDGRVWCKDARAM